MGIDRHLATEIKAGLNGDHEKEVDTLRQKGLLPNFIIIGAAKSATTTLTEILPRHPDFFISKPKEPKFFGRCYDKGWQWYGRLFREGRSKAFRGEGSTMYASRLQSFRHTPALMRRYLPDLKLIYVVRHPLDRMVSQWRHVKGRHPETAEFSELLHSRHLRKLVLGCSLYHDQLERYRSLYPDSQIHCLTFEDLVQDPQQTLRHLLKFLGATPKVGKILEQGQLPRVNQAGDKGRDLVAAPAWPPGLRRRVTRMISTDSTQMLAQMGKSSDYWPLP
jgi:hypothetical protein